MSQIFTFRSNREVILSLAAFAIVVATIPVLGAALRGGRIQAWPAVLVLVLSSTALLALVASRESLTLGEQHITITHALGPLHLNSRIPYREITDVSLGVFTFANWDPFVRITTAQRTYRTAWGVPETVSRQIIALLRERTATA